MSALDQVLAKIERLTRERDEIISELPFGNTCGTCGGAAPGNPVGPCMNCVYTGTEPSLATSVRDHLVYFGKRAEAAEARADRLQQALEHIASLPDVSNSARRRADYLARAALAAAADTETAAAGAEQQT